MSSVFHGEAGSTYTPLSRLSSEVAKEKFPIDENDTPEAGQQKRGTKSAGSRKVETRLKSYTTDDRGRKIPAPPHESREQLLEQYKKQKRSLKQSNGIELQNQPRGNKTRSKIMIGQPPACSEPLFPPLPLYGPPSKWQSFEVYLLRLLSFCCTLVFLLVVILGALFTSLLPDLFWRVKEYMMFRDPDRKRKFIVEERRRRKENAQTYVKVTDQISYYANLVDIGVEQFTCETLDGFTLHLQRLIDRRPQAPRPEEKYPVLLLHGLLQSSGAFCVNDEDSLAFYLCKQGFDVWLGNNRCWFTPEHSVLQYHDPRHWAWNIRQLGGLDLPALLETVCHHTQRTKVGFVGHSQGTTQTFCALSCDQIPEIGLKMDSFCALAPAVFAGALIDKFQFKFMRLLGARGFRLFFGINAFIPLMMTMQKVLPGSWYGHVGYLVFHFLFGWSDILWDRRLKSRFFQFSPVYVSAESMRWWMRDFALYRSILKDSEEAWYLRECFPPLAFWTCGQDQLVNGQKFVDRMNQKEKEITIVYQDSIEEYAHLDVLWAMDVPNRIGTKLKEVLWACASDREDYIVPLGCQDINHFPDPRRAHGAGSQDLSKKSPSSSPDAGSEAGRDRVHES